MYEELVKSLREYGDIWRDQLLYEAADAIEVLAKNATTTPRWISVEERLPFDSGKYLCKIKCPKGEWIEIDHWDGEDWYSTDWHDEKATEAVTHWMPLPEPPKEK